MFSPGHKSDGFLAYVSADVATPSSENPIIFNTEEYEYGNNYNPATGVYTVPRDGLYLIHARVYGRDSQASHFIKVDNLQVTHTREYDSSSMDQSGSTSIVLHLQFGQQVAVDPQFTGGEYTW